MCPYRLPPAEADIPEREGDYSTYTLKLGPVQTTLTTFIANTSEFLADESKILVVGSDSDILEIAASDLGETELSRYANVAGIFTKWEDTSVFNRYYAAIDRNNWTIRVWKDGTQIFQLDDPEQTGSSGYKGLVMSPSGHLLLVIRKLVAPTPDEYYYELYEAS